MAKKANTRNRRQNKSLSYQSIWSKEEDELLINSQKHVIGRHSWKVIGRVLNRSSQQCLSRFERLTTVRKGPFRDEEDHTILVNISKVSLIDIAKQLGRTSKQVRDRYENVLNPTLNRQEYTADEDLVIVLLAKIKNNRWALIAKLMQNERSASQVKNRYYSHIRKKLDRLENLQCKAFIKDLENNVPLEFQDVCDFLKKSKFISIVKRYENFFGEA